jgi:putative ABC transport system permease protein
MLAILPGVALQELWSLMGTAEKALFVVSLFVVLTGLIGMLTAILTSLNERRREMAILRSVGARPWHIATLLVLEAFALALSGVIAGVALLYVASPPPRVTCRPITVCLPLTWPSDMNGRCSVAFWRRAADGQRAGLARLSPILADGLSIRL